MSEAARPPTTLCRDCLGWFAAPRKLCPTCGSPRLVSHPELATLSLAHIDCDAFYASVEKRDDPTLADKPVIVGGGRRGVVSAACYIARIHGVHSAMPMFKALAACPKAVVIRPNMDKYAREGRRIRELMRSVTPLVEPLSIDEAFLDLAGTERLHGRPPAATLAKLALAIEREVGVTVSIGLSYNKFLAKISSDLDKPRGFGLVGRGEATRFLATLPVSRIWGVGKTLHAKMKADGYSTIGDLQGLEETDLVRRYGSIGQRLYRFGRGEDYRAVDPESVTKSVSTETTFDVDLATMDDLKPHLWRLAESLSRRLKEKSLSGRVVTLKLKSRDFRTTTRQSALPAPTVMADVLYRTGFALLSREIDGREFRLIGIGVSDLHDIAAADPIDLADPERQKRRKVEQALDSVREKLGRDAIGLGRGLNAMARGKSAPPETSPDETDRGRR